jgi:flagellar assembly protein FliH
MSAGSARIIRGEDFEALRGSGGPCALNFAQLELQADQILADARRQAERILSNARTEAKTLHEQAQEDGRRQGHQVGLEEGRQEGTDRAFKEAKERFDRQLADVLSALQQAMSQLDQTRQRWLDECTDDVLCLAIAVAERIIGRLGQFDRARVLHNLKEALELAGSQRDLAVHIHPDDRAAAEQFTDRWSNAQSQPGHVRFVFDEDISPGGAVVSFGECTLDATLETQLSRLVEELVPARAAEPQTPTETHSEEEVG